MPDTYTMVLTLLKNGVSLEGFDALVRRLTVDQSQSFSEQLATGSGDVALPIAQVGTVQMLALTCDQVETYKPGIITVNAGGFVILFNATGTTETIANASGNTSTNRGIAGGS